MSEEFTGWATVEIMGHRVVAGFCDHVRVAGVDMLRVTPPSNEKEMLGEVHVLSGASIFAVHPCTEERAREVARSLLVRFVLHPPHPPQLASHNDQDDDPEPYSGGPF